MKRWFAAAGAMLLLTGCGAQKVTESESLFISLDEVTDTATFYPVVVDGTDMEVLAIRDSSGNVRTAFNTCQSCYNSGNGRYEAEGTELVCQNCGQHFTADSIGTVGFGCNPWPITDADVTRTDETIEITYGFLNSAKAIFANW